MSTRTDPKAEFRERASVGFEGWNRRDTVQRLSRSVGTRSQQRRKVRAFYELLSTTNFFTETSLYFNLGNWADGPDTVATACEALADLLAAGRSDQVQIVAGDATELPFADETFDVVLALESAFHLVTRERFFAEAGRVLRPGGRLATADMLPLPRLGRRRRLVPARVRNLVLDLAITVYPHQNVYDRVAYARKLEDLGFDDVQVHSIRDHVYPAAVDHLSHRLDIGGPSLPLTAVERWFARRAVVRGPIGRRLRHRYDFVTAVVGRPAGLEAA